MVDTQLINWEITNYDNQQRTQKTNVETNENAKQRVNSMKLSTMKQLFERNGMRSRIDGRWTFGVVAKPVNLSVLLIISINYCGPLIRLSISLKYHCFFFINTGQNQFRFSGMIGVQNMMKVNIGWLWIH